MPRKKIAYIERLTDKHGIERVYGYTIDGLKYFLNVAEVVRKYEELGIDTLREV